MKRAALLLLAVASISGCAKSSQSSGSFDRVRATIQEREPAAKRVDWNTGSSDDAALSRAVRDLFARELSADDAVQVALLNNRGLQATFEDLGVAQADLVQAGLLRNPVFDAAFKLGDGGGGTKVDLGITAEFLDLLQLPLRKRVAAHALSAAETRVAGEVLSLAGRVRAAFYEHQAALQALEMRKSVAAATVTSADFARRLHDAGNITALQLAREQTSAEDAKLQLASAEADVRATRERLSVLMGLWGADTQWKCGSRLAGLPERELDVAHAESRAVEKSVDIAAARASVESAADALGIKRSVALFGGGDVEAGVAAEREVEGGWSVGPAVAVPVPLFDTGAASVSRAQSELRRARQTYFATAVEIRSAARAARDRLLAARGRAERLHDVILPLRHSIVEQTQAENNAMLVGTFDVLRAKQEEIEAGAQYVGALRDYWLARSAFQQITAGGPVQLEKDPGK
jgi:cobalt-zinc-cadmium efflux system outer membrane protein